jgi:hypothetical protein
VLESTQLVAERTDTPPHRAAPPPATIAAEPYSKKRKRKGRPIVLVAIALVAIAGIGTAALASGIFTTKTKPGKAATSAASTTAGTATHPTNPTTSATQSTPRKTSPSPPTNTQTQAPSPYPNVACPSVNRPLQLPGAQFYLQINLQAVFYLTCDQAYEVAQAAYLAPITMANWPTVPTAGTPQPGQGLPFQAQTSFGRFSCTLLTRLSDFRSARCVNGRSSATLEDHRDIVPTH